MIGGWDFVDSVLPAGSTEAPGYEDENSHGSHTASTAGGNIRTGIFNGLTINLSGVAPRANLVIYDVCYTNAAGNGLCPNVSTLAAINQVVSDGVVDVVNYFQCTGFENVLVIKTLIWVKISTISTKGYQYMTSFSFSFTAA